MSNTAYRSSERSADAAEDRGAEHGAEGEQGERKVGGLPDLRVAGVVNDSVVDGPGIRLAVFLQGCPRRCPGCHNPQSLPLEGGRVVSGEEILSMVKRNPLLSGVTFSGGEPFLQAKALAPLARAIRSEGLNIVTYTGYLLEEIIAEKNNLENGFAELLAATDILVDGPFVRSLRTLDKPFVGSSNQRVIDAARISTLTEKDKLG